MGFIHAIYYFVSGILFGLLSLGLGVVFCIYQLASRKSESEALSVSSHDSKSSIASAAASAYRHSLDASIDLSMLPKDVSEADVAGAATLPQTLYKHLSTKEESCVWLSAFCGRIYRDYISSPACHDYFKSKLEMVLNRQERPLFIDAFRVGDLSFDERPPLFSNIRWLPITCPADGDPLYDVVCSANMSFESSVRFTVSTTVWINWPRDHYASLPISLSLEVTQVKGKIRFGVEKGLTFLSFLGKPKTQFNVTSNLGSMSNVPLVSEIVVMALTKYLHEKLVHPGKHKSKLLWPKFWWPADVQAADPFSESTFQASPAPLSTGPQQVTKEATEHDKSVPATNTGDVPAYSAPAILRRYSFSAFNESHLKRSLKRRSNSTSDFRGAASDWDPPAEFLDYCKIEKTRVKMNRALSASKKEPIWTKFESARMFMKTTIEKVKKELHDDETKKEKSSEKIFEDPRTDELAQRAVGILKIGKNKISSLRDGIFRKPSESSPMASRKPILRIPSTTSEQEEVSSSHKSHVEGYLLSKGGKVWVVLKLGHLSIYAQHSDAINFLPPRQLINLEGSRCRRLPDFGIELQCVDEMGKSIKASYWASEKPEYDKWCQALHAEVREAAVVS